ncbi:Ser/Thr protein kinase Kin1-like protein [Encephalitozoon intestinalis ATCC 50506]|uniref:Ser/Thr protein kinase Kin1-like protein n=1 Tax=Encephalitozoon intestinalis (strain ATCC 50506) TaxID=876142 RepID=E0S696_ENCIT|nr:Ser/Thr protein kinase Kin1-like protein [Encephalitozoon intestinalis ATCC 50506]ADM11231.1 Ser/Thr protein kinase Kin1-like protein [Encephalitozoon intestinalis ATCC 50506]
MKYKEETPSYMYSEIEGTEEEIISLMDESEEINPSQEREMRGMIGDFEYIENKWIGNYRFIRQLGTGSSSKVVLGCDPQSGEKVAIKIIPKRMNGTETSEVEMRCDQRIFREVIISSVVNHPHIVRLKNFLYSPTHYFLIFEYVKGRQLYDIIISNGPLKEKEGQRYFRQLLSAVDYIHKNSIVHRDLKIENILIDDNDNVKLIDFGLSNFYDNKTLLNTFCGSLYFAAPELLQGQRYCGPEIDIWSLGVVLYATLCGCVPFDDENVQGLQEKIKDGDFKFCKTISREAQELIRGMIVAQPSSRMGLDQVIGSEWVNGDQKGRINSYTAKRYPIMKINERYIELLSRAIRFQFPNIEREIRRFHRICKEDMGTLEQIYWSRRPVVSLYYLVSENLGEDNENRIYEEEDETELPQGQPEAIHDFVRFIFSGERTCTRKHVKKEVLLESASQDTLVSLKGKDNGLPRIRQTYLKGFFRGIRVKHIGSHNALKKILLDIFNANSIIYEVTDKSYFCSAYYEDLECLFKVSMYFNVLLNEYYLTVTPLNSEKKLFKNVYEWISSGLRNRT